VDARLRTGSRAALLLQTFLVHVDHWEFLPQALLQRGTLFHRGVAFLVALHVVE
jgi:hypothetical protein